MEISELVAAGVIASPRKNRRQIIEQALVEYEYYAARLVKQPVVQMLIDMWAKYVELPQEDTQMYARIKQRIIDEFGEPGFYWIIDNTYLLHQTRYLLKKGITSMER